MVERVNKSDLITGVNSAGEIVDSQIAPASEMEISAFELKINATLPEDYREFLKTANGGRFNPRVSRYVFFDVKNAYSGKAASSSQQQILGYFFTLSSACLDSAGLSDILHLEVNFELYMKSVIDFPNRPGNFIPIANTPGSNLVLIGIRGEHKGKVVAYEYMELNVDGPLEDVFHIADSFDDFFEGLYV